MSFTINNITSDSLGIIAEEEEFLARAAQRVEKLDLSGVDGSSYTELGYLDIEQSMNLQILDLTKLDSILALFNKTVTLGFSGRKTIARFFSELQPSRIASIKSIPVTFIRSPFWYLESETDQVITSSSATIINNGTVETFPLLKVTGTGTVTVTLNDVSFEYTFDTSYVYVDCMPGPERKAYFGSVKKNRNKNGGWPSLAVGNNSLTFSGNVTEIVVTKRTRYL